MKELIERLDKLILEFNTNTIDINEAIKTYYIIIQKYFKNYPNNLSDLNKKLINQTYLSTLNKVNNIKTLNNTIKDLETHNTKLKVALGLV